MINTFIEILTLIGVSIKMLGSLGGAGIVVVYVIPSYISFIVMGTTIEVKVISSVMLITMFICLYLAYKVVYKTEKEMEEIDESWQRLKSI